MAAQPFFRLTVLAPRHRVDVALPTDVPVAELVPMVLELVGEPATVAPPRPWRLSGIVGGALPAAATLGELGVLDGEFLRLGPVAPAPAAPVFDDPVDAIAAGTAAGGGQEHRFETAVVLAAAAAAAVLLGAAGPGSVPSALLAAVGAVVAVASAARLVGPDGDPTLARGTALAGIALAAAAGWAAVPDAPGPVPLTAAAVAAGIAAAAAQLSLRVVAPTLIAAGVVAVVGAMSAIVVRLGATPVAAATGAGALAVIAAPLLPRAAIRLAGLPRPVVPADEAELTADDLPPPPAELAERTDLARGHLAGLAGAAAVIAAVGGLVAAFAGGWAGPTFAGVTAVVLVLRARGYADTAPARTTLAAGAATGIGLVAAIGGQGSVPSLLGCTVLLVGAGTGIAALDATARDMRPEVSPVVRRAVDLVEGVLVAAAVPLAFVAMDLFELVREVVTGSRLVSGVAAALLVGVAAPVPVAAAVIAPAAAPRTAQAARPRAETPAVPGPRPPPLRTAPPSGARPGPARGLRATERCTPPGSDTAPAPAGSGAERLQLAAAHRIATGAGQVVAVIDTGVAAHPRLANRLRGGGDYLTGGSGLTDCDGHGTAVAGIIAASEGGRDDGGVEGIAPAAQVLAIRQSSPSFEVAGPDGGLRPTGDIRTLADAIVLAVRSGATVINISEAVCLRAQQAATQGASVQAALRLAARSDVVVVAAAGNAGVGSCAAAGQEPADQVALPGWYDDDILTVGAVGPDDAPAGFSVPGAWVDVAAPGSGLRSLAVDGGTTGTDIEGTSFAAPWAAGLAALLRERFPNLTAGQIVDRILATARRPTGGRSALQLGRGVIDPVAALTALPDVLTPDTRTAATAVLPGTAARPAPAPPDGLFGLIVGAALLATCCAAAARRLRQHPLR